MHSETSPRKTSTQAIFDRRNAPYLIALIAITILGAALRFIGLEKESLWGDEINTAVLARQSLSEINFESLGQHPPLQFLLTKLSVSIGNENELFIRLPSALYGVIAIPLAYFLFSRTVGLKVGLSVAFLVAIAPPMIWYSQEARPYMGSVVYLLVMTFLLVRLLESQNSKQRLLICILLALVIAIAQYNHYYFAPLILILLGAMGLISFKRRQIWPVTYFVAVIALSSVVYLVRFDTFVNDTFDLSEVATDPLAEAVNGFIRLVAFGRVDSSTNVIFASLVWIFVLVGTVSIVRSRDDRHVLFAAIAWGYPAGLLFGTVAFDTPLKPRYFVPTLPFWFFLSVSGVIHITRLVKVWASKRDYQLQLTVVTTSLVIVSVWSLSMWSVDYRETSKEQWREIAELVVSEASTGDVVYMEPFIVLRQFEFYAGPGMEPLVGQNGSLPSCFRGRDTWTVVRGFRQTATEGQLTKTCDVVTETQVFAGNIAVTLFRPRLDASDLLEMPSCDGSAPTIVGTPGDDDLRGTDHDDVIHGMSGNDMALASDGDDLVCGGEGNDVINAGSGSDRVLAGDDKDTVNGGDGNDILIGGAGVDTLNGGPGEDELDGGTESDTLNAGPGNDIADGGVGDDTLNGGDGDDDLQSGEGDDVINAGPGDDTLRNQAGADILRGGPGEDSCLTSGLEETLQCETSSAYD